MDIKDILSRLEGVHGHDGQYMAKCPAHRDGKASLSVGIGQEGRVLLKCQAGCGTQDILETLGLTMKDLFVTSDISFPSYSRPKNKGRSPVVATYTYQSGAQKLRREDKSFTWRHPDGKGGWEYNRKGIPHELYVAGEIAGAVFVAEGEKDANTLHELGCNAVSGADGAGPGKWRKEYTEQLRDLHVCVFQDNDQVGKDYAAETCSALHGVAASVRLLDLSKVWPEIPEHGDVSDMVATLGSERAMELISQLVVGAPLWEPSPPVVDPFLACFKTLDKFEEQEATWLVPGWIPEGQITLMAADGGIGKTTLWCNIITALSNGTSCVLDPEGHTREPQLVAFLTTEDSVRKKLKKKLREAGANERNVITPDFAADKEGLLRGLKFASNEMERFIRHFKPALCVFDPVQGFVPPEINMGSRNAMRDALAPLITLGEETGTTFLVICHTNKRKGASGRDRVADSADLWDISRSVLMAGYTEDRGIRYLSNEKNNYCELQETMLFSINSDGAVVREGTSWKRDREYMQEATLNLTAPKRDDCKEWLKQELDQSGGALLTKELEERAKKAGYSYRTLRRAKDELKQAGEVKYCQTGNGKEKVWRIQLVAQQQFMELLEDTPTPWTDVG